MNYDEDDMRRYMFDEEIIDNPDLYEEDF